MPQAYQEKSHPKRTTRSQLAVLLKDRPDLSPTELAAHLDVSVTRVRGIAEELGKKWIVKGRWGKV